MQSRILPRWLSFLDSKRRPEEPFVTGLRYLLGRVHHQTASDYFAGIFGQSAMTSMSAHRCANAYKKVRRIGEFCRLRSLRSISGLFFCTRFVDCIDSTYVLYWRTHGYGQSSASCMTADHRINKLFFAPLRVALLERNDGD